jgi:hypothetical protein
MSPQNKTKIINIFKHAALAIFSLVVIVSVVVGFYLVGQPTNKSANAASPNTANLIIGTVETASTVSVSVCVQATDGPIHLTDSTVWLGFDNTKVTTTQAATPSAGATRTLPSGGLSEIGQYGNNVSGYDYMKWEQVSPLISNSQDRYALNLLFTGGAGLPMSITSPELLANVQFSKVGTQTSPAINILRSNLFSTETPASKIDLMTTNVTTDCRGGSTTVTTCPAGQYLNNNACATCPTTSTCSGGTAQPVACASPSTVVSNVCTAPATTTSSTPAITCTAPNTIVNSVCTAPTNIPAIGTSVATTTTPIGTAVGNPMPIIPLIANTYPNGTVATFTPAGSTTPISGTIINGSFVPNAGQVVPAGSTTGATTGVLAVGNNTLNIPTNFTSTTGSTTIGLPASTTTNPVTGVTGSAAVNIPLIGCTIPDNTIATFTPAGSTVAITGKIVGCVFVPDANQVILTTGVTTGPAIGVLKVIDRVIGVPTNFTPATGFVPSIGTASATTTNPIGGSVGGQAPAILLDGNTYNNGTVATFTPAGSTTPINGTIINGYFVPNAGQVIPTGTTIGPATGVLKIGNSSLNIPINFAVQSTQNTIIGGNITTICIPACSGSATTANTPQAITSSPTSPIVASTVPPSKGEFKSKLRITDPYVCGEGSYGNVTNPKQFGVDFVYYDFYKVGATESSYSFKLRVADNGDFFLPISKSTNIIKEDDYKVVFYAYDSEGNKAQGDYTDKITYNCTNSKVVRSGKTDLPRTGGLEVMSILTAIISTIAAAYLYKKSSSKRDFKLKM